jgi:hypothetical protein
MMKRFIILLFAVFTASAAFAQYPNAPNKMRLGAQTTGNGLIFRHAGEPSWTPTGLNNAWLSIDTLTGDLYAYRDGNWFLEIKGDLQQVYPLVINKTGSPILRGQVVSVDTSQIVQGDQIRIMPAIGDGGLSSNLIMGVAATDIADNASGYVAWFGYVREVDQTDIAQTGITLNVGDILYLSATEPGRLTNVEPTPPALKTTIALVVRKPNANNMTLLVRPKLNEDLSDLNDVDLNGINNGQTIVWDSINTKWIAGDVGGGGTGGDIEVFDDGNNAATITNQPPSAPQAVIIVDSNNATPWDGLAIVGVITAATAVGATLQANDNLTISVSGNTINFGLQSIEAKNPTDAANKGVPTGTYYRASANNTMGLPKGTLIEN